MSLMPFVVALEPDDLTALNKVVEKGRDAELAWLDSIRELHGIRFLRGKALSRARAEIRTEFRRLRELGRLAGTRDLVVTRQVRAELKHRGMDQDYDPVPAEDLGVPGRRVGAGPRHYGRSGDDKTQLTGRMYVKLPGALGDQLTRGCYWTSAPAVTALWEWQTLWGDGPEVIFREAERRGAVTILDMWCAAMASRPTADAILQKAQLQEQIVTTGDIIRAAVKRAIH
ncbi:hypothetical protein [Streptomyces acidiscabies]|uniref:hypothetical protein n=1 Tax=Streptomyces acidiscabies TaxID=42234 RepID=UPI000E6A2E75|nr:hypothetical protein [Streptomyces acidiscabies]MBP5942576.1 hypothetical protein [Streptomyces sp. LBUM 1476]MBP5942615.1 hypothetical protein [Streptomyces sp. LBUM 1476]